MKTITQVKILIRCKYRYLLLQKARDIHQDHVGGWEVPGGKIKPGETAEEAAGREIREETGLKCALRRELTPLTLEKEGITTVTRVFLGEVDLMNVKISSEHSAYRWVLPEEIDALDNVIYRDLLKKYIEEAERS